MSNRAKTAVRAKQKNTYRISVNRTPKHFYAQLEHNLTILNVQNFVLLYQKMNDLKRYLVIIVFMIILFLEVGQEELLPRRFYRSMGKRFS